MAYMNTFYKMKYVVLPCSIIPRTESNKGVYFVMLHLYRDIEEGGVSVGVNKIGQSRNT